MEGTDFEVFTGLEREEYIRNLELQLIVLIKRASKCLVEIRNKEKINCQEIEDISRNANYLAFYYNRGDKKIKDTY